MTNLNLPVTNVLQSLSPQSPCLVAGLPQGAIDAGDVAPLAVESEETEKEFKKIAFPVVEGDTAPSAMVPKASQAIQKHVAKIQALYNEFTQAPKLSLLQTRILAFVE